MPVIINDFEVVEEREDQPTPASQQPAPPPQLSPAEIERIVRRMEKRRARLHAD